VHRNEPRDKTGEAGGCCFQLETDRSTLLSTLPGGGLEGDEISAQN
jgi:hypothetical protein